MGFINSCPLYLIHTSGIIINYSAWLQVIGIFILKHAEISVKRNPVIIKITLFMNLFSIKTGAIFSYDTDCVKES